MAEVSKMSERTKKICREIRKATEWLKKNGIEDPDGHLARKCATEKIEFLEGRRKN